MQAFRGEHMPAKFGEHGIERGGASAPNLTAIKAETLATWPMTSLLDMLKEADLRLNFTDVLKSATAYETFDRTVLRPRLLLCLNGLGTNAGFQHMAGLQSGATAKDLAYVRRRYISVDAMRQPPHAGGRVEGLGHRDEGDACA